ncbi:hypothetical protein EJ02DRAFT_438724 [Clathrospora elynae]|uniref:DUF3176 domain-containing protein n=1 Tax=Clathrospora elynae TaxID=706981 RepID=A0A6A5SFE7_9PLEO|nr:hypothetical protein EJ02DRAFT_438724 [Clathrospora elynae]
MTETNKKSCIAGPRAQDSHLRAGALLQYHNTDTTPHSEAEDERKVSPSSGSTGQENRSLDFTQRIEKKLAEYNASNSVFKRWLFEMLSWLISAFCMIAIVFIYVHVKDRPISESASLLIWTNVLGKVASAALIVPTSEALGQLKWNWFHNSNAMWDFEIFDKASRGPWGALMLLFRTKGRSLAALGALLVVLLLAIDTFFQQVVEMPDRWTLQTTAAVAPMAYVYDPGSPMQYRDGFEMAQKERDTFLVIEKFSYGNGTQPVLFGNGTRPDIPVSCPTSNCTWPLFETLSICSQCADISSQLSFACVNHTVDWKAGSEGMFDLQQPYPNATGCGYFLNATSENPTLMSGYLLDPVDSSVGEALIMRTLPLTTLTGKEPLYGNGSILFKHVRHSIADLLIVSASNGSADAVYRNTTPVAQECIISWCIKTMKSSYSLGEYSETVVATFLNTTSGPFPWESFPYETELENGTDIFYMENITFRANALSSPSEYATKEYGTSNTTASSIITGFNDIFPAFTTMMNESATPVFRYKTWKPGPSWTQFLSFNPWLAPNNVTRHMERLAMSMTNVIRSAPSRNDVIGHAYGNETYISVRWEWLIFPLLLLLLSLAFLVSTMIKTSKDGATGIWKTSAMPALIYSLPKETQGQFTKSSTWSSAKDTKKLRIRLLPDMGWRVSGHSQLSMSPQLPRPAVRAPRGWI